jgi:hypothetical protein
MDFEGSDTLSFTRIYEQYGAENLNAYSFYKFDQLPFFVKLFKK